MLGGARGRVRTGTIFRSRDFRTTSAFAAVSCTCRRSWSGARLHLGSCRFAVGARRLLSTPSRRYRYPTGLVRCQLDRSGDTVRAFADFDGCHLGRFPPRAQLLKSLVSTYFTTRAMPYFSAKQHFVVSLTHAPTNQRCRNATGRLPEAFYECEGCFGASTAEQVRL